MQNVFSEPLKIGAELLKLGVGKTARQGLLGLLAVAAHHIAKLKRFRGENYLFESGVMRYSNSLDQSLLLHKKQYLGRRGPRNTKLALNVPLIYITVSPVGKKANYPTVRACNILDLVTYRRVVNVPSNGVVQLSQFPSYYYLFQTFNLLGFMFDVVLVFVRRSTLYTTYPNMSSTVRHYSQKCQMIFYRRNKTLDFDADL